MTTVVHAACRTTFFPKADAAVLFKNHGLAPTRPPTVKPIFDPENLDNPIPPWSPDIRSSFYPPKPDEYAPSPIPIRPAECLADRYLRAFLAENERLRLSMLWYYTRNIFDETEFLCGLREKLLLAQESTGWEFVVIGLLDINVYIRLGTIGLPQAILPRGETICAHTVTQPPGSVFLLPNMMEDWRFRTCPYLEAGGIRAYAGVPLRLQNEVGETVGLGSLCVCSTTSQPALSKSQQSTLARLADWVVSDIIQCTRARRQRERHRMIELIAQAQKDLNDEAAEEAVTRILRSAYPDTVVTIQSTKATRIRIDGRDSISPSDLEGGLWEDSEYLDELIARYNHQELPCNRVVRMISAHFQGVSGPSLLIVGSRDFRLVFDDVDLWFVQACADMLSQTWHKHLLTEAMRAKEKFLRGFSHQLRTPVHGILGSAELLAEELKLQDLKESVRQVSSFLETAPGNQPGHHSVYLDTIMTAGRDLISIINNMITLNKWADVAIKDQIHSVHSADQLEAALVKEMLKFTLEDTRYNASFFFDCNLPADYAGFETDLGLLRESLLPLLVNSIQNTPEGIVTITISVCPDTDEFVIDIEDTGRGIRVEDQQRIFEPYEKVEAFSTGAGLGLTLASKFAALLHGSVTLVSSEVGRGSHFRAKFKAIRCVPASLFQPTLRSRLENLPATFYRHACGSEPTSLSRLFARFLVRQGFHRSDSTADHFVIFDFVSDPARRQASLPQILSDQIAICLVPAANVDLPIDETSANIIYIRGPFLTSTLVTALEQANQVTAKLRSPQPLVDACDEPSAVPPARDATQISDETHNQVAIPPLVKANATHAPVESINSLKEVTSSTVHGVADAALPESNVVVPIFSSLPSVSRPTALLVDDNNVNLRIMQMYCKKRGLPHFCATDGLQAVEVFSKQQSLSASGKGAPIQLILMDLQMPVCDGIDATEQIRLLEQENQWQRSVIFVVTGQDSPKDRTSAENAGADDYYVKPVSIKLLDRGVKRRFPAFDIT